MSHLVTVKAKLLNVSAINKACRRLNLDAPEFQENVDVFGEALTGWTVKLPGWKYPVVINKETGEVQYDNYEGSWGQQAHLDSFLQAYATEAAKHAAEVEGKDYFEERLPDGTIKLTINDGPGKTIAVLANTTGGIKVETDGYNGVGCQQASEFVTKALGDKTGETLKSEFYQAESQIELDIAAKS